MTVVGITTSVMQTVSIDGTQSAAAETAESRNGGFFWDDDEVVYDED